MGAPGINWDPPGSTGHFPELSPRCKYKLMLAKKVPENASRGLVSAGNGGVTTTRRVLCVFYISGAKPMENIGRELKKKHTRNIKKK